MTLVEAHDDATLVCVIDRALDEEHVQQRPTPLTRDEPLHDRLRKKVLALATDCSLEGEPAEAILE